MKVHGLDILQFRGFRVENAQSVSRVDVSGLEYSKLGTSSNPTAVYSPSKVLERLFVP